MADPGNARLLGILRGWTDGAYDGGVWDLAVDPACQKQGIGREFLARLTETPHAVGFAGITDRGAVP